MSYTPLPGTDGQLQQLRALVKKTFVAIVAGPPGSGKKTAVRHIAAEASLRAHDVEVEHAWSPEELRARIAKLGTQLTDDPSRSADTLWLVHNAEILERCAAVWKEVECRGHRVLLLMHDVPRAYRDHFSPIHFNRLTDARMREWVRREYPQADEERVAKAARGDLNQAKIAATFRTGDKDLAGHVSFDTQALVNGGRTEPEKVSTDWVHENMLERCTDIEAAAALSETFALTDAVTTLEGAGGAPTAPGIEAEIVQRAVRQVHASGKARWVKGVHAPKRVVRPGLFAVREWRRYRGMSSLLTEDNRGRKRSTERADQSTKKARKTTTSAPTASATAADGSVHHAAIGTGSSSGGDGAGAQSPAAATDEPIHHAAIGAGSSSGGSEADLHLPAHALITASRDSLAPSDRLVYNGRPEFEVRPAVVTRQSGERRAFRPGPPCGNFAKSRVVFFAKCRGLDDFRAIAETAGVLGCIVAEFDGGTYALVFKERNREFKTRQECYALCDARVSHAVVEAACAWFTTSENIRNVEVQRKYTDDQEMPDFEDACELLKDTSIGDFGALHANALKAKKYKRCTPIQEAILTYTADLKDFMHAKEDAESMVFKTASPGPHFLHDFKRSTVLGLEGVHFESDGSIRVTTLRDAISQPQSVTKPPLYLTKTLIFVGLAGGGKSEYMHALAREFCKRKAKPCYGFSASIDPYGLMTKSGKMKDLGCICLYDFTLVSRLDHLLGREEVKGLLYTKERAHVPARYHQCILYEWVPRVWSVNYGVDDRGNVDKTEWFTSQGLPALAALLKRDAAAINSGGEHDKAIARRALIFCVDENLFEVGAQGATDAVGLEVWRAEQANATPLDEDA